MSSQPFRFKQFKVFQDQCSMKIGTDGVLLGAWANTEGASSILDIGAGTGVIALMLAQRCEFAKITAVEVDSNASTQAEKNMQASPWSDRLVLENLAIQEFTKQTKQTFDLIVCNPPFFSGGTFSSNQARNNVRHTIKLPNGDLLRCAKKLLSPQGRFSVILPYLEGLRFKEMAETYGLYTNKITSVIGRIGKPVERLLIQLSHQADTVLEEDELIIQIGGREDFSDEYKNLTRDFYLKMA